MRRVVTASLCLATPKYLRVLGSYCAAVDQLEAAVGGPLEN